MPDGPPRRALTNGRTRSRCVPRTQLAGRQAAAGGAGHGQRRNHEPQLLPGTPASPASRTWIKGFRNPFRLAQRPGGTQSFYITDVGWGAWEEVNVVPASRPRPGSELRLAMPGGAFPSDYTTANTQPYESGCPDILSDNHDPLVAYDSSGVDHAIIGSAFYSGAAWPSVAPPAGSAAFFYSDYPSGEITRLQTNATDQMTDLDVLPPASRARSTSRRPGEFAARWPDGALRREHRRRRQPVRDRWQGVAHHRPLR